MKINNNLPIGDKTIRKSRTRSNSNRFAEILDTEMEPTQPAQTQQRQADPPSDQANHDAWHTLEESISLLDHALQHLESGHPPSPALLQEIESLRSQLRQHAQSSRLSHGEAHQTLNQADTLLAVEAERIRAMQS